MNDTPEGWYTDPENPSQLRWWDGTQWTFNTYATTSDRSASGGQLRDVGQLIRASFEKVFADLVTVVALSAVLIAAPSILTGAALARAVDGMVIVDRNFGKAGSNYDLDIRGLEGGPITVAVIAAAVSVLLSMVFMAAMAHLYLQRERGHPASASGSLTAGLRAMPKLCGLWLLMIGTVLVAAFLLAGFAVLTPLTLLLTVPLLVVGTIWAVAKVFAVAVAAVDDEPMFPTSASVSNRAGVWPVLGRLALLAVVSVGVSIGLGVITAPLSFIGDDGTLARPKIEGDLDRDGAIAFSVDDTGPLAITTNALSGLSQGLIAALFTAGIVTMYHDTR